MRVLHVIGSLSPRLGGPSTLRGLGRALVRAGCDVSIYTTDLDEQGTLVPWRRPRTLALSAQLPVTDGGATVRSFRTAWPSRFVFSPGLAAALVRDVASFDLVHVHSLYLFHGLVAGAVCRHRGVPYVLRPHGSLDRYHRRRGRWRKAVYHAVVERRNVAGAAAIHFTSTAEAEQAADVIGETPYFVVPQGIDAQEFASLPERGLFRSRFPALAGRRVIGFLGRITAKKGLDLLVPAFAGVAAKHADTHLVLAGPDDGYASVVRRLVERHGVVDRVTWTGLVTGAEKVAFLRDTDIWALPSFDENFGIAVVEAMAAGAPVVISDRVGIHREVERARAGIVVPATVEGVGSALERLLTDDVLRAAMAANARRTALESFTWDSCARRLVGEYERIRGAAGRSWQRGEGTGV